MLEIFYSDKVKELIPQYKKFLEDEVYPVELQIICGHLIYLCMTVD